jgi:DNA mismatch repair protein MutL
VHTFGFRGEALPAIGSVSRLELTTATSDGAGVCLSCAGGAMESVVDVARRRGTTVSVSELFYNTPARRKFLRSARSEWRSIVDAVAAIALTRRDVRVSVTNDGKSALNLPATRTLKERVAALWGGAFAARMIDVDRVVGPIRVAGLVERPADVGTGTRRAALVVNARAVRDGGLVRAAEAAYRTTITAGLRPSLVLELSLPGDAVDVNVHPAKVEVRFHDRWSVERAVESAVRHALGTQESVAGLTVPGARTWTPGAPSLSPWAPAPAGNGFTSEHACEDLFASTGASGDDALHPSWTDVPDLVQLKRNYILFEQADGVVLIDQHSAHERVLFERFMRTFTDGGAASQRLLFPATLHLSPDEADAFDAHHDALARLGFEIESFGGHSIVVHAVPAPHPRFDALRCLRETLAAMSGDRVASTHARHEKLVATVACKAAVKAGDALSMEEMRALWLALARTDLPAHDVHGRAAVVRLSWDEVDRRFGRS